MKAFRARRLSVYVAALLSALAWSATLAAQDPNTPAFNVLTWQIDHGRTGQNLSEIALTAGALTTQNFGQLCHADLDGQVYAQPLVVTNVTITANGTATNYASVVYVVTQSGTLYAISGAAPAGTHGSQTMCTVIPNAGNTLTGTSLLFGRHPVDCNMVGGHDCATIKPYVSILGTPVINATVITGQPTTGTLYVVVETQDCVPGCTPANYKHWLYAVDISSLQVVSSVQILPPTTQAQATFSQKHIQRPGLLYANGNVYIAFSLMDGSGNPGPNGAIFRYSGSVPLTQTGYFPTTPDLNQAGAGVWQGGAGLTYWSNNGHNYIFFNTGNGNFTGSLTTPCSTQCGDSFVKLDADTMTVADSFTPFDQFYRSSTTCPPNRGDTNGDIDWGSGGVMFIPDGELGTQSYLAVSGDKEGGIWVQNRSSLGKYNPGTGNSCNAQCSCTSTDTVVQTVWTGPPYAGNVIHTTPGYWESGNGTNYLYVATQTDGISTGSLNQYTLCTTTTPICSSAPVSATNSTGATINFSYGATPAASAAGLPATAALLWVIWADGSVEGTTPGRLYAFNAVTMKQIYVSSGTGSTCAGDVIHSATKFSVPTVANGHVYIGTQSSNVGSFVGTGTFYIFGLNRTC